MKYIALILTVIIPVAISSAYGGYSITGTCDTSTYCTSSSCTNLGVASSLGCSGYNTVYINAYAYGYCEACSSGYVSTTNNRVVPGTSCQISFTSCSTCPSPGIAGGSAITSCYIPSGTAFSDNTGTGQYSANCYYKA